jgi:hypothetical protein
MAKKQEEKVEARVEPQKHKYGVILGKREIYHSFMQDGKKPVLIYHPDFQQMTMREKLDELKDKYDDELELYAKPGDILELDPPEYAPPAKHPNTTAVLLRARVIKEVE